MNEIWKPVKGFEGLYECSSLGMFRAPEKVENTTRRNCVRKAKMLKTIHESNGYLQIRLRSNGKEKAHLSHRLIATTFIPLVDGKNFVNHINGIKDDNRVENLEWVTKSENCIHSFKIGLQSNKGEQHPRAKITDTIVRQIRGKYIPNVYGCHRLAKEFGMSKSNILDIINHRTWSHVV